MNLLSLVLCFQSMSNCMVSGLKFYSFVFLPNSAGTNIGDITIWEVGSRERLVSRNFEIWDLDACSMALQV